MIPYRLISAISGQVHLIEPSKASAIMNVLSSDSRASVDWEAGVSQALDSSDGSPYRIIDGMAVVPVEGTLMHQMDSVRPQSGSTGYDGMRAAIQHAAQNDFVSGLILDINSPGGMVSGLEEVAKLVADFPKPTAAYVDAMAFSAAYYIASQADVIVSTPSGEVGSIGALITHVDRSGQMEQRGLNATFIHAGENKTDGNPIQPLPEDVRRKYQAQVDRIRNKFARAVGRGRGSRFSEQAALATEAETYEADAALEMGMIDAIAPPEAAISTISGLLASASNNQGGGPMALTDTGNEARADAQADAEKATAAALAKGHTEGVTAERERMSAIMSHPKAGANPAIAQAAVASGLTLEQASLMLDAQADAPKQVETEAATDVTPSEDALKAAAKAGAQSAIKAMMDGEQGTGIGHSGTSAEAVEAEIPEEAIMKV